MSEIKLVKAIKDDLPEVLALRIATMSEHLEEVGWSMSEDEHMKRVMKNFDCGHMIWSDNAVVGFIKYKEQPKSLDIIQFQISPEHQGKGLGKMVLEIIESQAHTKQKGLSLKVLKANPAKRLYERFGFKVVGEDEFEFFMEKSLKVPSS
ncbi:GNAT family N-acetyltransferase [Fulvivirga lutimaris]|uniref:GNAT family N-acetyltransferase n=1 Tax=Fulvivirga lutimaris TaxID=1819566 RepID=UPI0012BD6E94|nr:GNAT family N-acetyltransferase [Fulvivirga lutimaris]MTI39650.1 N-acetyltransferase [Fulvivirga lutimaris]